MVSNVFLSPSRVGKFSGITALALKQTFCQLKDKYLLQVKFQENKNAFIKYKD